VEDCARTLQAIAGHEPHDAYTWEVPVPDSRAALDGNLVGTRVGVVQGLLDAEGGSPRGKPPVPRRSTGWQGWAHRWTQGPFPGPAPPTRSPACDGWRPPPPLSGAATGAGAGSRARQPASLPPREPDASLGLL
jgi:hypothetical protein